MHRKRRSLGHKLTLTENMRFSALLDAIIKDDVNSVSWSPHPPRRLAASVQVETEEKCEGDDEGETRGEREGEEEGVGDDEMDGQ